jgi:hypothetical protein
MNANLTLANVLESTAGRFVTVTFTKKDGTLRTINGRTGVIKHLKGGKSTIDRSKYIVLYSNADDGYRCINKDTIKSIVFAGIEYTNVKG